MTGIGRVYLRGGTYHYSWSLNGRRYRRSSHSDSRTVALRMLTEAVRAGYAATADGNRLTFEQIVERVKLDRQIKGRRSDDSKVRLKHLRPFFAGRRASEVTTALVERYVVSRMGEDAAPASINRELALLRRALRLAEVSKMPRIQMLPEDNVRRDFLDWDEFQKVRSHLPQDCRDLVTFFYLSSWRQGQVCALEWRDVDMRAREVMSRGETTKSGEPHRIPLVGELWEIVARAHRGRRLDCVFVFQRRGRRFDLDSGGSYLRTAWATACREAKLPGRFLHGLRRSGIRNMLRAGVDPLVAMKVSGHKTAAMLQRYNIISPEDQRVALERTMGSLTAMRGRK